MDPTIELNEATIEGEQVFTEDFFFNRIGVPIPVMLPNGGDGDRLSYDQECLPSQALAVSNEMLEFESEFVLLVVAHSSGFLVARIEDVIGKMLGFRGPEWELVPVGRVRLLSFSSDSSTLAACVGGTINFFSFESLISKEKGPFLSRTIDGGSSIKDMRWLNGGLYILLTNCGNLYLGRIDGFLKLLKCNVDAVDCSPRFDYIAMASNDKLSILSSKLNKELHIALSLQPWTGNPDDFSVKVDSLKWVCPDRIILGCFQLTSDGMEGSYLLLVISLTVSEILTQLSLSIVYVQSFRDVFPGIVEDIMPAGSGPHLFFSCLESYRFAIAANRKNVDQHIVLLDWLGREEMALIYVDRDHELPRIELQENGDDNSILGLCINEISQSWIDLVDGVFHMLEDEIDNPLDIPDGAICILWCLSLEGKLSAFSVAR